MNRVKPAELTDLLVNFRLIDRPSIMTAVNEARDALKHETAERIDAAFQEAVGQVGSQLQNPSAKYVVGAFASTLSDAVYSLWDQTKRTLRSPLVESVSGGFPPSIANLAERFTIGVPQKYQSIARGYIISALTLLTREDGFATELANYSKSRGKSVEDVLNSKRDSRRVVEAAYGSVDNYRESVQTEIGLLVNLHKMIKKDPKLLAQITALRIKQELLSKGVDSGQIGLNVTDLGTTFQNYVKDIITFADAFIPAYTRRLSSEIGKYQPTPKKR